MTNTIQLSAKVTMNKAIKCGVRSKAKTKEKQLAIDNTNITIPVSFAASAEK